MSPAVKQVLDYCKRHDIKIVSWGLAPNPFGFCFERGASTSNKACVELSRMLDGLTGMQEQELRHEVFG